MEVENKSKLSEAYPMNGGHGVHSYVNNSSHQGAIIDATKEPMNEAIAENFDMEIICNKTLRITDMGCSVGPNTFVAVENIIEAIQNNKSQAQGAEFQVFFNDHASNDFNSLFASLPSNRKYYATAVPGSFYTRLFPASSLHIVHSSYALQWLSQVPKQVADNNSPAWNKGKIYYSTAGDRVINAYAHQFGQDMANFLHSRSQEIIPGGLLLLTVPGRLNGTPHSQVFSNVSYDLLGACLMEMVQKGIISEEKVDSFNIPIYFTSPQEVEEAVKLNGCFNIEIVEYIPLPKARTSIPITKLIASHMRAGFEALLKYHFGPEILDHLFHSFVKQLEKSDLSQFGEAFSLFFVLKRKASV